MPDDTDLVYRFLRQEPMNTVRLPLPAGWRRVLLLGLLSLAAVARADLQAGLAAAGRQDWAAALAEFKPLAEKGDPAAEINLGNLYMRGLGVPQDYGKALQWYRRAADQGDAAGQSKLGLLYYYGLGVPLEYGEAARWFRRAAEQGEVSAQTILGSLYSLGEGVEKNNAEAYFWYTLAAEQGSPSAAEAKDSLVEDMAPGEIGEALDRLHAWQMQRESLAEVPVVEKPRAVSGKKPVAKKKRASKPATSGDKKGKKLEKKRKPS
jgi:TPR repeat protein